MLYPIAIEKGDATHAHGITVPDIPGCFSAADNMDDAIENTIEAITGHLQCLVEDGEDIPLPPSIDRYVDDPEYAGMIWALVPVDVSRYLGETEKINVTLLLCKPR